MGEASCIEVLVVRNKGAERSEHESAPRLAMTPAGITTNSLHVSRCGCAGVWQTGLGYFGHFTFPSDTLSLLVEFGSASDLGLETRQCKALSTLAATLIYHKGCTFLL